MKYEQCGLKDELLRLLCKHFIELKPHPAPGEGMLLAIFLQREVSSLSWKVLDFGTKSNSKDNFKRDQAYEQEQEETIDLFLLLILLLILIAFRAGLFLSPTTDWACPGVQPAVLEDA